MATLMALQAAAGAYTVIKPYAALFGTHMNPNVKHRLSLAQKMLITRAPNAPRDIPRCPTRSPLVESHDTDHA